MNNFNNLMFFLKITTQRPVGRPPLKNKGTPNYVQTPKNLQNLAQMTKVQTSSANIIMLPVQGSKDNIIRVETSAGKPSIAKSFSSIASTSVGAAKFVTTTSGKVSHVVKRPIGRPPKVKASEEEEEMARMRAIRAGNLSEKLAKWGLLQAGEI